MKDNKKLRFLTLNVLKNNSSIESIIYEGFKYVEIADETAKLFKEGFATEENKLFVLTEKGEETFNVLSKLYSKKEKRQWIEKDLKNKIPQIDKKSIFLPRQDELTFIKEN